MVDVSSEFFVYVAIGFAAQLVDGALGMAFGVISSTILLSVGQMPVIVSASVHSAELATTGFSAISHISFKNVNWKLCLPLALFGALGGIAGALVLGSINGDTIKPYISGYLGLLGLFILWKAWRGRISLAAVKPTSVRSASLFGLVGGALDACGGGGWGPVVTSNLVARGDHPRQVIGSVNTAEFIVTLSITLTFAATIGLQFTDIVAGLLCGGVLAAPLGAYVLRFIPPRFLMVMVGLLITGLSSWQIYRAFLL